MKFVTKGTGTTTGGVVLEGHNDVIVEGKPATSIHQYGSCASGRKSCKGKGIIVPVGNGNKVYLPNGQQAALSGYQILCNCPDNFILESNSSVNVGENVSFGSGVSMTSAPSNQSLNSQQLSPSNASTASQAATPQIDPKNAYWPPYDFTAKEGEKQIEVIYRSQTAEIAIFTPEEWKKLFEIWDFNGDVKTVKDSLTGLYNARETAKALGGLGVTAIVRNVDGVEYLFLNNYDKFKQTILHGGVFRADNAQVVKMGIGALDSVKGMTRYVKTYAPAEFLIGSGINGLKYLLTDDYTLRELGVDEAKLLVNAVSVAGTALVLGKIVAFGAGLLSLPVTVPVYLSILAFSAFGVWLIDKETDFEKRLVEAVVDEFDGE
ncbi:PAAR domain-containing protein [Vibrio sp. TRT 29B02]|uniref:PAAR domain-containing protein n=1 Tax=Vibrio sp. TRT 29B02 TaxID=3418508 RepID=UPI003CF295EE